MAQTINENYRLRQRSDGIWEVAWIDINTQKTERKSTSTRDKTLASEKWIRSLDRQIHRRLTAEAPFRSIGRIENWKWI